MTKLTNNSVESNGNGKISLDIQQVEKHQEQDKKAVLNKFVAIRQYLLDKYDIRKNIVACDYEYTLKGLNQWKELNLDDLTCELLVEGYKGIKEMLNPLITSSIIPSFDPLIYYFENLHTWDETQPDYIDKLAGYVETTDDAFFRHQFKMMLVRVVAQALGKIAFNKQCFTLYGKQNDGKTSFLRFLCPTVLSNYIKDGIDFEGKDSKRALAENLFINLDELATLGKADMNRVKAYFTETQVKLRIPYDKKDTVMRRRASFVGSTNKQEILTDETGNVRWLLFQVTTINHGKGGPEGYAANVDINNVWAQAAALLKAGYRYTLTDDELKYSERNNQQYTFQSDEMALILKHWNHSSPERGQFMTSTDIASDLIEKTNGKIRLNSINIGRALNALKFDRIKENTSRNALYGYYLEEAYPVQTQTL